MSLSAAVRIHRTESHERSPPPTLRSDRRDRDLEMPPASSKPSGSWTVLVDKRRVPLPSFFLSKASRGRILFPL